MFVLGHIGIGSRLGRLVPGVRASRLPAWLILGTLLPDLVDKPLYYGLSMASETSGGDLGLITCTRTIGHSALFALLLCLTMASIGRRAAGWALFAGMATHWLLDLGGDTVGFLLAHFGLAARPPGFSSIKALTFPFLGKRFAYMPYRTVKEHLLGLAQVYTLAGEVVGGALIFAGWRSARTPRTEARAQSDAPA